MHWSEAIVLFFKSEIEWTFISMTIQSVKIKSNWFENSTIARDYEQCPLCVCVCK